jgi:hypothetical protein
MNTIIKLLLIIVLAGFTSLKSQIQETTGPTGGDVLCLLVSGNNLFAGTQTSGVFLTTNSGDNWTAASTGIAETQVNSLLSMQNFIFACTPLKIYRTSNNGSSWQALTGFSFPPACIAAGGNNLYAGTGNKIYRSSDLGITWVLFEDTISVNAGVLRSIALQGNTIFAGHNELHFSSNNGATWTWAPLSGFGTHMNFIYPLPNSIIACADMGLFRSSDPAALWERAAIYVNDFLSFTNIDQYLFAGHSLGGILFSTNDGANWTIPAGFRVQGEPIHALTYNADYIFVGAKFRVWRIPRSVLSINQVSTIIPRKYNLYQNYPNPFNPQTTIKLDIAEASEVNLMLYNSLGEAVSVLYKGKLAAGTYEYTLNAEGLASGVYFYRLSSGEYFDIKKLVLLK